MIGKKLKIEIDNMNAPKIPPIREEQNAALKALAAIPFFDKGKPSITVA